MTTDPKALAERQADLVRGESARSHEEAQKFAARGMEAMAQLWAETAEALRAAADALDARTVTDPYPDAHNVGALTVSAPDPMRQDGADVAWAREEVVRCILLTPDVNAISDAAENALDALIAAVRAEAAAENARLRALCGEAAKALTFGSGTPMTWVQHKVYETVLRLREAANG